MAVLPSSGVGRRLPDEERRTGGTAAPPPSGQRVAAQRVSQRSSYPNNRLTPPREYPRARQAERRTNTPRPQPRALGAKGAGRTLPGQGGGGPSGGLSPNAPYDPWASPYKTQGQFNTAVSQIAQGMYQPRQEQLSQEETGQRNLSEAREGDNRDIYKQYGEQANAALARAKEAMAEIAARQNGASSSAQGVLGAALGAPAMPNTPVVPGQANYMQAAAGSAGLTAQNLGAQQTDIISELAGMAANAPSAGLTSAQLTENKAEENAMNKVAEEREGIAKEIPDDVAKAREQLTKEEVARANDRLQRELVEQKLGIEGNYKQAVGEADKERASAAKEGNAVRLAVAHEKAAWEAEKRGEKQQAEEMKLKAARLKNAISWFSAATQAPKGQKTYIPSEHNAGEIKEYKAKGWQPVTNFMQPAMEIYNYLTGSTPYGLTAPEAFSIMKGNAIYRPWADEHYGTYKRIEEERQGKRSPQLPGAGSALSKIRSHPLPRLK